MRVLIIEDEDRMSVIWSNMMGKDEPWGKAEGSPEEIEAKINKQKEEAALFLAQKAIEDNAPADGVKVIQSSQKYKAPGSSDSGSGGKSSRLTVGTEEDIETYRTSLRGIPTTYSDEEPRNITFAKNGNVSVDGSVVITMPSF